MAAQLPHGVLVATLGCLVVHEALFCGCVGRVWSAAARDPHALAGLLRLASCAFAGQGAAGEDHPVFELLGAGRLDRVSCAKLVGVHPTFAAVLAGLVGMRRLVIRGVGAGCDDAQAVAECIDASKHRLESLDVEVSEGFDDSLEWPRAPALRSVCLRNCALSLADVRSFFGAKGLEALSLHGCPLVQAEAGIVASGADVRPRELLLLECGARMVLTLMLSVDLSRLEDLRLDARTNAALHDELACALPPPDARPASGSLPLDVQERAEAELRAELRRAAQDPAFAPASSSHAAGSWRRVRTWLAGAERHRCGAEVHYVRKAAPCA